jgi:hypothetical protein
VKAKAIAALLLFDIVTTTFIPGKISSEKKVSKLRSIAELKAFYGTLYLFTQGRRSGGGGGRANQCCGSASLDGDPD